jgi:Zn-dependent protease with chaperone function
LTYTPIILVGYAALLIAVVGPLLATATWPERAPRLGIAAWQVVSASIVVAVILGALTFVVPAESLAGRVASFVEACVHVLRTAYATPQHALPASIALAVIVVISARLGYCLSAVVVGASRARRRHAQMLALVASPLPHLDVVVVRDHSAVVYCIPGRERRVVVTTGALESLTAAQLQAVLAHERAHLRGRHDVVLLAASALARAFPVVPLFSTAHREIARLLEMLADDEAGRRNGRSAVATALVHLATCAPPRAGLGAGGPTVLSRVHRLMTPARPLGAVPALLGGVAVILVLLAPTAMVVVPAVAALQSSYCELPASEPRAALIASPLDHRDSGGRRVPA